MIRIPTGILLNFVALPGIFFFRWKNELGAGCFWYKWVALRQTAGNSFRTFGRKAGLGGL